jgi:hypothetical protein
MDQPVDVDTMRQFLLSAMLHDGALPYPDRNFERANVTPMSPLSQGSRCIGVPLQLMAAFETSQWCRG